MKAHQFRAEITRKVGSPMWKLSSANDSPLETRYEPGVWRKKKSGRQHARPSDEAAETNVGAEAEALVEYLEFLTANDGAPEEVTLVLGCLEELGLPVAQSAHPVSVNTPLSAPEELPAAERGTRGGSASPTLQEVVASVDVEKREDADSGCGGSPSSMDDHLPGDQGRGGDSPTLTEAVASAGLPPAGAPAVLAQEGTKAKGKKKGGRRRGGFLWLRKR